MANAAKVYCGFVARKYLFLTLGFSSLWNIIHLNKYLVMVSVFVYSDSENQSF